MLADHLHSRRRIIFLKRVDRSCIGKAKSGGREGAERVLGDLSCRTALWRMYIERVQEIVCKSNVVQNKETNVRRIISVAL